LPTRKFYEGLLNGAVTGIQRFYTTYQDWTSHLSTQITRKTISSIGAGAVLMKNLIMPPQSTLAAAHTMQSVTQMLETAIAMAQQPETTATEQMEILGFADELLATLKTFPNHSQHEILTFTKIVNQLYTSIPSPTSKAQEQLRELWLTQPEKVTIEQTDELATFICKEMAKVVYSPISQPRPVHLPVIIDMLRTLFDRCQPEVEIAMREKINELAPMLYDEFAKEYMPPGYPITILRHPKHH
jgi:hypothetical protein